MFRTVAKNCFQLLVDTLIVKWILIIGINFTKKILDIFYQIFMSLTVYFSLTCNYISSACTLGIVHLHLCRQIFLSIFHLPWMFAKKCSRISGKDGMVLKGRYANTVFIILSGSYFGGRSPLLDVTRRGRHPKVETSQSNNKYYASAVDAFFFQGLYF